MDFPIVDLMGPVASCHPGRLISVGHHLCYPIGSRANPGGRG
jgi:hypothetical protein